MNIRGHEIFEADKLFFAIHVGINHWALIVVYMQLNTIAWYDSAKMDGTRYIEFVKKYLYYHAAYHYNIKLSFANWHIKKNENQRQTNDYDCGVFTLMHADFISDGLHASYVTQQNMDIFRLRIAQVLEKGRLAY